MGITATQIDSTHAMFVAEFRYRWEHLEAGVALFRTGKPLPEKRSGYLELTYHIDYREGREDWIVKAMADDLANQLARVLVEIGGPLAVGGLEFQYDPNSSLGTIVSVGWNCFEPQPDPWMVISK